MATTNQSPSSSSYEDDEEEEQVEKKTQDSEQESDDDEEEEQEEVEQYVVAVKKTNQEEKEEEEGSTRVNQSKKRLLKNADDKSKLNDKKQTKNEAVVVALSSVDDKPKPNTTTASTSSGKMNPFERKWSDGDELVLLQGMINYKKTHDGQLIDTKPAYEILLQSIKNSLSFDYTISQLQNKIRSLKRKYDKVVLKIMSGVENPFENNSHEEQSYNLSKVYWEDVKIIHHQSSKKKKKLKVSSENCEFPNYYYLEQMSKVNNGSLPITLTPGLVAITAINGWEEAIGKDNVACMNQKSKDLMIAEGEVFLQRCELIIDQTKLMLDALKK